MMPVQSEIPHEIERKFLLAEPLSSVLDRVELIACVTVEQRYLQGTGDWTTRIRQTVRDGLIEHWITFKRKLNVMRCVEMETKVDATFYGSMSTQCGPALHKVRYMVLHEGHIWELDLFTDSVFDNLVVAEIELEHEGDDFVVPDWVGKEVTCDPSYKNAKMVQRLTKP
jgi:adenylate cyclase